MEVCRACATVALEKGKVEEMLYLTLYVLFDPANDKVYRHPTFYDLPDEVKNM